MSVNRRFRRPRYGAVPLRREEWAYLVLAGCLKCSSVLRTLAAMRPGVAVRGPGVQEIFKPRLRFPGSPASNARSLHE